VDVLIAYYTLVCRAGKRKLLSGPFFPSITFITLITVIQALFDSRERVRRAHSRCPDSEPSLTYGKKPPQT
jgi:hypothetical protein